MGGRGANFISHSTEWSANSFFGVKDANGMYSNWISKVDKDERNSVERYTGSLYESVNEDLRTVGYGTTDYLKEHIDNLDSAIAKFDLKRSITVYRGSGPELIGGYTTAAQINANLKGAIIRDNGYMSTSAVKGSEFDGIKYQIQVPKGKGRGAYIDPISHFKGTEHEFLLKRGTKFKVLGATTDRSGYTVVKLKVVG